MLHDNGANPLRWDCTVQGCFNRKKRPKIEIFADCLPRRIAFTDVDGIVEVCGNLLLLEWKEHRQLPTGQRLLFERLTRFCPAAVFVVTGDAERMQVESVRLVWRGVVGPAEPMGLEGLRREIRAWSLWAAKTPAWKRLCG